MINITNWPTQKPEQVDPAVIVAQDKAWRARIAQLTAEERALLIQQRQQRAKEAQSSRRQSERQVLQHVVQQLPKPQRSKPQAGTMPPSIPNKKKYRCKTCKDAGFIRQDLPDKHPQFGRAKLCPNCGLAINKGP